MIKGKSLAGIVTALALLVAPLSAPALATWDRDQELDIEANVFTQVLFFDFETSDTSLSTIAFGDREVDYFLNFAENDGQYDFVGAFLFDFAEGEFTAQFYAGASDL